LDLGVWNCAFRKIPIHLLGPVRIPDRDCESVKVREYVILGGDGRHFEEPGGLFQRLICMPSGHQEVLSFSRLKFLLDDAEIHDIMDCLAPTSPSAKVCEAATNEGPKDVPQSFLFNIRNVPCQ